MRNFEDRAINDRSTGLGCAEEIAAGIEGKRCRRISALVLANDAIALMTVAPWTISKTAPIVAVNCRAEKDAAGIQR